MTAKKKAKAPDLIAIANKLRSVVLVLEFGGNPAGPIEVAQAIVDEIDAWESNGGSDR